jgi:hypothetical protein
MATQEERLTNLEKHARTTDENLTILLGTIGEQGRDIKTLVAQGKEHNELLKAIETAIQLMAGSITNMRTELLVIKALIAKEEE